ncbi:molybdopterin-dependent oxidoreductase [Quadrisphaera sp. GCM10027208]|uniref:molybdopterin-containing oxidoreductase family protein n=1 Tax=Quadrisphaera sp. GCM10027208 TaxID=3273423 RepID=UPI00361FEEAF
MTLTAPLPLLPAEGEQVFSTACTPNCWMNCRIYAHVRDGKLVETTAAPLPDPRYNRICLRGLSHPQRVYGTDRITTPLRRAGKRGENLWEEISWDEALDEIATKLTGIRQRYGNKAVCFAPLSGSYAILNGALAGAAHRMANVLGGTLAVDSIDLGLATGETQVAANLASGMAAWMLAHQPEDIANARTIIAWGTNVTESQVHNWHFFADALDNGAKLIVIDPRFSEAASKAHIWVRPRPGSDSALAMSMVNTVIEEGLYDETYLRAHTVATYLVREDNGLFLRANDLDPAADAVVLAMDPGTGKPVPADDNTATTAIFGTFQVDTADGAVTVRPAFQLLADTAAQHSPEAMWDVTDVEPALVREVARRYATAGPSFIYSGMGIDRWDNADLVGRGLATLGVITGQIGKPGATPLGSLMGGTAISIIFTPGVLDEWTMPTGTHTAKLNYLLLYDAVAKGVVQQWVPADPDNPFAGPRSDTPEPVEWPVKAIIFNASNFVSNFPNQNRIRNEMLAEDNLELVVSLEMVMNDTARMADIVLPVTSWFENDDLCAGMHPFLMRQQKAIANVGQARSDYEIFGALAQRLGVGEYFTEEPTVWIDHIVDRIAEVLQRPQVAEEFRRDGVARLFDAGYIPLADGGFMTPSGKAEFYAEGVIVNFPESMPSLRVPVTRGVDPLPHFEPPFEAWRDNPKFARFPLVLNQRHSKYRVHSTWYEVPVLREMDPEPLVELNEREMAARGLVDGDVVRVFNDRGEVYLKVRTNNAYPDNTCNINKGWQRHQFLAGGYQELTHEQANVRHYSCSFFDVLVQVAKVDPATVPAMPEAQRRGAPTLVKEK